jgi:large subunit ribosomal protein L6
MSRIGKQPIVIPDKVTITKNNEQVVVEGPKGKLEAHIPYDGEFTITDHVLHIQAKDDGGESKAFYGMARALVFNMVKGVSEGFVKTLKIVGVGYRAQLQGDTLQLNVGYSHPVTYHAPEGITLEVPDQNTVVIKGIDKHLVGQVAAEIRKVRAPEPYKGKGIMYADETIRRKAGKAGVK